MYLPLSWRWPRWWWVCYAWCTSWIPFGAALRFNVSRGGAGLVRLASSTSDNSEGCLCADLGKWFFLGFPQCPACLCAAGALFVALCGTGPRPYLEVSLCVTHPLIGVGIRYTGHALSLGFPQCPTCFCAAGALFVALCGAGPRLYLECAALHGTCSLLLLPCTTGALAPLFAPARNALDAALDLSRLGLPRCFHWLFHSLGKPLVAPSWLRLCAATRFPFRRLAARPVRALPWPVRPLVAWRANATTPHAAGVSPAAPVTSSAPIARSSLPTPASSVPASADPEHDS
ncbi:hypothetical protein V6N13_042756 [Hibiscus sabdariffa]